MKHIVSFTILFIWGSFLTSPPIYYVAAEEPPLPVASDISQEVEEAEEYDVRCFCVTWLREVKGLSIRGHAKDIVPNVAEPFKYGVVLIDYGDVSHAGYIEGILPNGKIYYQSANETPCEVTYNTIAPDDPRVRGFYYRNPN